MPGVLPGVHTNECRNKGEEISILPGIRDNTVGALLVAAINDIDPGGDLALPSGRSNVLSDLEVLSCTYLGHVNKYGEIKSIMLGFAFALASGAD